MDDDRYPMPLYLNQEVVFDLLAIMEGGLSRFESIRTVQSRSSEKSSDAEARVGASNVFAFLGLALGGGRKARSENADTTESQTEKVYTPNALFAKVRQQLQMDGNIRTVDSELRAGNFVEFEATLRRNPLVAALETMKSLGGMFAAFQAPEQKVATRQKGIAPSEKSGERSVKDVLRMIDAFLAQLTETGSIDLIGKTEGPLPINAVLTIDPAFLRDLSMSDILDGQYRVLGKVTRVVKDTGSEGINLLRKTSLGAMTVDSLSGFVDALGSLPQINLPEIITKIDGPAIQVMPISIFA